MTRSSPPAVMAPGHARIVRRGDGVFRAVKCLLVAVTFALLVQGSQAGKRYSYYWWDVSLLQEEGHKHVSYTEKQQELVDGGAVSETILKTAREIFLINCVHSMSTMPWNCSRTTQTQWSSDDPSLPPPYFGKFIDLTTRQAAFVHALSTAVLLQEMVRAQVACGSHFAIITRNQTRRAIAKCTPGNYKCCESLVERFVSDGERQGRKMNNETYTSRVMINHHNRKAGIKAFAQYGLGVAENCYGISGTCMMQQKSKYVKEDGVSNFIRQLHDTAEEIKIMRDIIHVRHIIYKSVHITGGRTPLRDEKPRERNLIYQRKLGFCNRRYGLPGPAGRLCREDGTEDGITCEKLCCGRGVVRRTVQYTFPICIPMLCCHPVCIYSHRNGTMTFCR